MDFKGFIAKNFLRRNNISDLTNDNPHDGTSVRSIGNIVVPEKLKDLNAFLLASTVSEINFPVDFYADRISKLRFYIADKNEKEIEVTELNRFITNINPFYTFSDLVYQYVFSYLADGNVRTYLKTPSIYGKATVNSISRADILHPYKCEITENLKVSLLNCDSYQDAIQRVQYLEGIGLEYLRNENLRITNFGQNRRDNSVILSKSPLFACNKSIDTLLSVYSARYNVYANNGYAGFLTATNNTTSTVDIINQTNSRDKILADINSRAGLTGRKNLWGISGIPLAFLNTLCTIKDLMPFDETLEDSIKIASCFQIPTELVPRKDQSTFNNKDTSERAVWENGLLNMAKTVCNDFTKIFTLDKAGCSIRFDSSNVSALMINQSSNEDLKAKKIANIKSLIEIYPEKQKDLNKELDIIIQSYGSEQK